MLLNGFWKINKSINLDIKVQRCRALLFFFIAKRKVTKEKLVAGEFFGENEHTPATDGTNSLQGIND